MLSAFFPSLFGPFSKVSKLIKPLIIITLFSLLYLYKLSSIPNGLYVDEAAIGYNAYAILKTARDEYGKFLPIAFKLFGSYTPPLFVYFVVPFVKILGLSVFSIRFASVFVSLVTALIIYSLSQKLKINPTSTLVLFLLSPWNLLFARTSYEIYFGFFLFCLSAYLFFQNKHPVLAYTALSLSAYASHPQRILAPIFLILFILFYKKINIKGLILAALIQIPHFYLLTTPAFWVKSNLFKTSIYNFLAQAVTYLSPSSLFLNPDPNPQRSLPLLSALHPWMIFPYFVGIYHLFHHPHKKFFFLLILSAIIPASLANDPFSTQRNLQLLLPLILIISLGVSRFPYQKIMLSAAILVSLINIYRSYFILLPNLRAQAWNYGHQELAQKIKEYSHIPIVIDYPKPSYILIAFFQKISPPIQNNHKNYYYKTDFSQNKKINNLEFRPIHWKTDLRKNQILIGSHLAISQDQVTEHSLKPLFFIKDPLGNLVFQAYRTQ